MEVDSVGLADVPEGPLAALGRQLPLAEAVALVVRSRPAFCRLDDGGAGGGGGPDGGGVDRSVSAGRARDRPGHQALALGPRELVVEGGLRARDGHIEFARRGGDKLGDDVEVLGRPRPKTESEARRELPLRLGDERARLVGARTVPAPT